MVGEALYHYIQNDTGETLSSQKRDNKLELAKLIWRETSRFYEEETGQKDESGRINARLIQECLDDMESLPADKTRTRKEKLAVIASYLEDTDIRAAGGCAALGPLDYRMLHFCLRHRLKRTAYLLCVLRNVLVQALRKRKV